MAFRLGEIIERKEHGILRGVQREIACECWFTSKGRTIPKIIKVMDEEGFLHTIHEIQVLATEEKTYSGIQTVEHLCRISFGGRMELVKLVFTKESCTWSIVVA